MQRLFSSWTFWIGSILFGLVYLVWAGNIENMRFGDPTIGDLHFVHWLFVLTPFLAFAAGLSCLLVGIWYLSLKTGIAEIAASGVEGALLIWLLGATCVCVYATEAGSPLLSAQRNMRVSTDGRTYLLQGTGGGSGTMFYRLFRCDHLELICTDMSEKPIVLGDNPGVHIDSEQQIVTIMDNGHVIQIIRIPARFRKSQ